MNETKDKNIWVPVFVENVLECVFFSVEITHGAYLSKEIYSALFFQKLVRMIDESIGEDLIEDIELYFPSLMGLSTSLSNEDIVLKIVESEEFYYGFPPIQDDSVECIKLEQISEKGIDGCDRKEFYSLLGDIS